MYYINMKKLTFKPKLNKNLNYLVAVSGGPDSMALLDSLFSQKFKVSVAHVNYKLRASANRDQKIVETYCQKNKIKLFKIINDEKPAGNFQDWARNYRFNEFKKIYDKINADALIVAHHQDDKIETYLIKKQRKAIYSSASILPTSIVKEMKVIRPLLNYSKADLISYCKSNNIDFGVDETNLKSVYQRNKIRKEIVKKLTKQQKQVLVKKIEKDEKKILESKMIFENLYQKINQENELIFKKLNKLSKNLIVRVLYNFIVENTKINPKELSKKRLLDYHKQLLSEKPNLVIDLGDKYTLVKSYDRLKISHNQVSLPFVETIKKIEYRKYKNFSLSRTGDPNLGVNIVKSDLPLTIRSYQSDDLIKLKAGHKKVSRLFIDKKVPLLERSKIPLVVNAKNEILLVGKYYVNPMRKRLQKNLFVIKY